jgi:putative glycosyltransferase (TIGR04372 family)
MPRVIDYAHSQVKSDWMDVFLCSQCRFMIATSSGMCVIALNFGVPLVMTNLLQPIAFYHFTSKDLFIPRLLFSREKGRLLGFGEMMSPPAATTAIQSHVDDLGLQIVPNTPQEIRELVEEMLAKGRDETQYNEEDDALQERFKRTATECGKAYVDKAFELSVHARMGRNFLRKRVSLLPCAGQPPHAVI